MQQSSGMRSVVLAGHTGVLNAHPTRAVRCGQSQAAAGQGLLLLGTCQVDALPVHGTAPHSV